MPLESTDYNDYEDVKLRTEPTETKYGQLYRRIFNVPIEAFDTLAPAQGALMKGATGVLGAMVQRIGRGSKVGTTKVQMIVDFHELVAQD